MYKSLGVTKRSRDHFLFEACGDRTRPHTPAVLLLKSTGGCGRPGRWNVAAGLSFRPSLGLMHAPSSGCRHPAAEWLQQAAGRPGLLTPTGGRGYIIAHREDFLIRDLKRKK